MSLGLSARCLVVCVVGTVGTLSSFFCVSLGLSGLWIHCLVVSVGFSRVRIGISCPTRRGQQQGRHHVLALCSCVCGHAPVVMHDWSCPCDHACVVIPISPICLNNFLNCFSRPCLFPHLARECVCVVSITVKRPVFTPCAVDWRLCFDVSVMMPLCACPCDDAPLCMPL